MKMKILALTLLTAVASARADDYNNTPLMWAAHKGDAAEVEKLLAAPGAAVNATRTDGATALHFAAASGCVKCVELLLGKGALLVADKDARTPLHEAAGAGSL